MRSPAAPSPHQDTTEQETKHSLESPLRRKTIKTLASGGVALAAYHVLPESWERPLIEQVFLPAHAGPSGVTLSDPCSVSLVSGTTASATVIVRVDGYVTPPISGLSVQVAATPSGAGNPASSSGTTSSTGTFSLQLTITGGPGITAVSVQTSVAGASGVAVCSVGIPAEATTPGPTTPGPTTPGPTLPPTEPPTLPPTEPPSVTTTLRPPVR